jgi:hypothetical protein
VPERPTEDELDAAIWIAFLEGDPSGAGERPGRSWWPRDGQLIAWPSGPPVRGSRGSRDVGAVGPAEVGSWGA